MSIRKTNAIDTRSFLRVSLVIYFKNRRTKDLYCLLKMRAKDNRVASPSLMHTQL